MNYKTIKETALCWGVSERTVSSLCSQGRVAGAQKFGTSWAIPEDAEKPDDPRRERKKQATEIREINWAVETRRVAMPLINTAFKLGTCIETINAIEDEDTRNIALAEYYYFSGQSDKVAALVEPYLTHEDIALRVSACWLSLYANLVVDGVSKSHRALELIHEMVDGLKDKTPIREKAYTVSVSTGASVLLHTASGVKIANTIWANDVSLHGSNGLPVTGVSGTLTVSGIQYATTKSTVAAHIGAQGVDVGRFDDSVFDIRDVDDFSPFVLLDVADFSGTVIELTGVTEHTHSGGTATCTEKAVCEICGTEYGEALGHDFRGIGMDENEHWSKCSRCDATGEKQAHTIDGGLCTVCEYQPTKDGLSTGAIVAIVIACVVVLAGGGFALYWFVFKKKKA